MNESILLDFEISNDQLEALNLHLLFKQKGSYGNLDRDDLINEGIERIQVWFQIGYNDNNYDVEPIMTDLIIGDKVVRKVKMHQYSEIEIPEYDGDENFMQSFTITPKML